LKNKGRDYRVQKESILEWLGLYGEALTNLVEDVFEGNEDLEEENTTAICTIETKLYSNNGQWL
jgi:hypothetical protein